MRDVYLSKSNRASPEHIHMVRVHLIDKGYNVIEHKGGEYDSRLLLNCKHMVMVGVDRPTDSKEGIIMVGKGQYTQLRGRVANGLVHNVYFSHTTNFLTSTKDEPVFRSVMTNGVVDENNWTLAYGMLKCKMSSIRRMTNIASHAKHYPEGTVSGESLETVHKRKKIHLACITLFN